MIQLDLDFSHKEEKMELGEKEEHLYAQLIDFEVQNHAFS